MLGGHVPVLDAMDLISSYPGGNETSNERARDGDNRVGALQRETLQALIDPVSHSTASETMDCADRSNFAISGGRGTDDIRAISVGVYHGRSQPLDERGKDSILSVIVPRADHDFSDRDADTLKSRYKWVSAVRTWLEHGGNVNPLIFLSGGQHGDDTFEAPFASGCEDVKHACSAHLMADLGGPDSSSAKMTVSTSEHFAKKCGGETTVSHAFSENACHLARLLQAAVEAVRLAPLELEITPLL